MSTQNATRHLLTDAQTSHSLPHLAKVVSWVSFLGLAFDFKGQESGGAYQSVSYIVALSLLSSVAALVSLKEVRFPSRVAQIVLILFAIYLMSTFATALIQQVPKHNYIVLVAPYLLFFVAFWFASGLQRRYGIIAVTEMMIPALKLMVFVSLVWTLIYGLSIEGVTIVDARYRAVSALIPLALVWVVAAFAYRDLNKTNVVVSALVLVILVIGQTRVYLLVLGAAVVLVTYATSRSLWGWASKIIKISLTGGVVLSLSILFANMLASELGPNIGGFFDLWAGRFLSSEAQVGFDITTATRLAEYSDQISRLTSSPSNFLLGLGLGAPYTYSGTYAEMLVSIMGRHALPVDYWNGGHSLFVYSLYASGLIFGMMFLGLILFGVLVSIRNLNAVRKSGVNSFPFIFTSGGYFCFVVTGLTAFPMGSRPVSLVMGLSFALLLGQRAYLRNLLAVHDATALKRQEPDAKSERDLTADIAVSG